jgi:DNA-binding MarR family transcriptional regulator
MGEIYLNPITLKEIQVIHLMGDKSPVSRKELIELINFPPNTLNNVLNRLEERGYIFREKVGRETLIHRIRGMPLPKVVYEE